MTEDELRAELVRLGPELDTNYARVRGNVWVSAKS